MFARLVTIGGRREQVDEFARIGAEKVRRNSSGWKVSKGLLYLPTAGVAR
jgi:hypothetical protein